MGNVSDMRRIDSNLQPAGSIVNTAVTAGGTGDTTAINGATIDRVTLGERFSSAMLVISARATMASGETLKVTAKFQDSANDSDWTDYGDALALTTIVTAIGGAATAKAGHLKLGVDLTSARRYVRGVVQPDLSRAGTDTATIAAVVILGGASSTPRAQTSQ